MKKNNLVLPHFELKDKGIDEHGVQNLSIYLKPLAFNDDGFAKTHGEAGVKAMAELAEKEAKVEELVTAGKSWDEATQEVFGVLPFEPLDIDLTQVIKKVGKVLADDIDRENIKKVKDVRDL